MAAGLGEESHCHLPQLAPQLEARIQQPLPGHLPQLKATSQLTEQVSQQQSQGTTCTHTHTPHTHTHTHTHTIMHAVSCITNRVQTTHHLPIVPMLNHFLVHGSCVLLKNVVTLSNIYSPSGGWVWLVHFWMIYVPLPLPLRQEAASREASGPPPLHPELITQHTHCSLVPSHPHSSICHFKLF